MGKGEENKDLKNRWWDPPLPLPSLPGPPHPHTSPPSLSHAILKAYLYSCKKCGNYIHSNCWFKHLLETE